MYDLSSELSVFYNEHVKLPKEKVNELYDIKDINISRLKDGLNKYNDENKTDYVLDKSIVQGSVGMGTVTQNEENDYDIDVGVLIDETNMKSIGSSKARNVVFDAFNKINVSFNTPPEKLTNCVRITYAKGYRIDLAVYRENYQNEHAGKEWRERDPNAINDWFKKSKETKDKSLTKTIQLIKMFSKSKPRWKMPGGLIITILVEENLTYQYERIDEILYYTIKSMIDRLKIDEDIHTPIYPYSTILYNDNDRQKVKNLKERLEKALDKLSVLTEHDCTKLKAIEVWQSFFNHSYWDELYSIEEENVLDLKETVNSAEKYIHHEYPLRLKYKVEIGANVDMPGFRNKTLNEFLSRFRFIPKGKTIEFSLLKTDTPEPYDIYWKVRNVGIEAYNRDNIRGQIINKNVRKFKEHSSFKGPHFVECYVVKNGACVAKERLDVPM